MIHLDISLIIAILLFCVGRTLTKMTEREDLAQKKKALRKNAINKLWFVKGKIPKKKKKKKKKKSLGKKKK